jgi:hypothetical protein
MLSSIEKVGGSEVTFSHLSFLVNGEYYCCLQNKEINTQENYYYFFFRSAFIFFLTDSFFWFHLSLSTSFCGGWLVWREKRLV